MSVLSAQGVVCGYGPHDLILKGVGIEVEAGEIVAIIGPNGAGKSTFLKAIAGLLKPREGTIRFGEAEIAGLSPREVAMQGIAFVPQEANVFASLSVRENLEVAGYLDRKSWQARAAENFRQFPILAEKQGEAARSLSGGQRQSLAMAMGLMVRPTLMLLDEPSAGLSPKAAEELFEAIRKIRNDGITILIVEQNVTEVLRVADRAYLLVDGRNSRDGRASDLAADPEMRQIFLGM